MTTALIPLKRCFVVLLLSLCIGGLAQQPALKTLTFGGKETLTYAVEWRMIRAGTAKLTWTASSTGWQGDVHLESAGLVSKLYRVDDSYTVQAEDQLCTTSMFLKSLEGKRSRETLVTLDRKSRKANYLEKDRLTNSTILSKQTDVTACVHDLYSGLQKMRTLNLEPGQSGTIPITDGKKFAQVKIDAQEREDVRTPTGLHKTIRYEVAIFNNVLYNRKAQCFIWITDDARRVPVQIRVRMQSFLVGNINLTLEKEEH